MTTISEHGGFVGNYMIQDPMIMECNQNTSSSLSAEKRKEITANRERRRSMKIREIEDERIRMQKRHRRLQTKVALQQEIKEIDGVPHVRVNLGKKIERVPQRVKNYTQRTLALGRAANEEQRKIKEARQRKQDRRRQERMAAQEMVSG